MKYNALRLMVLLLTALVVFTCLTGCFGEYEYSGEYPDMYTEAIRSLIGAIGRLDEVGLNPEMSILDEDEYGRVLYSYYEGARVNTYNYLIMQKSDEEYVYFYQDYNFISSTEIFFSEEDIEKLKEYNDWGKETDNEKCTKAKIEYKKTDGPLNKRKILKLASEHLGNDFKNHVSSIDFITTDLHRRLMYICYGKYSCNRYIVFIFNPDGSYDEENYAVELEDLQNYQDQLKAFKDANNWDKPLE